jgi:hypothetical protein
MRTPEEGTRVRVPEPRIETIILPEARPERPAIDRSSRFGAALVIVAALVAVGFVGAYVGADRLDAVQARLDNQVEMVDALRASSLFDAAGLYTGAREAGTVGGRPFYDAAGLYTGLRETGTIGPPAEAPHVDPTGMYTPLREGGR